MSFDRSSIRIGLNTDDKAKVVADDLKKRMKRIAATWRNECFEKLAIHPVHTTPNHHPSKMDVLPKTFLQINLAVNKMLVRHLSTYIPQPAATTFAFPSVFILLP